ncbi:MAG TPA: Amuc_1100 family pilus-like protein, partial [Opitutales bacterium]|nr:Amuc_1100 family pilus-like protein [Opitutales bacterium]
HLDESGEPAPIETPANFAFGFERYIDEAVMLQDPDKVSSLDKQRQILSYLLTQLIEADPQSINAVRRESVESVEQKSKSTFSIDPAVSARVPGAIDTMAFSITFSGYTDVLREFLNSLAQFELPIVVRSVEVERPSGKETVVAPPRQRNTDNIFDLFGGGQEETTASQEVDPEGPKPVIEENISRFTVILEFIEVVLPDTQNQEVSDPA